jgi:hypothetical protein
MPRGDSDESLWIHRSRKVRLSRLCSLFVSALMVANARRAALWLTNAKHQRQPDWRNGMRALGAGGLRRVAPSPTTRRMRTVGQRR